MIHGQSLELQKYGFFLKWGFLIEKKVFISDIGIVGKLGRLGALGELGILGVLVHSAASLPVFSGTVHLLFYSAVFLEVLLHPFNQTDN